MASHHRALSRLSNTIMIMPFFFFFKKEDSNSFQAKLQKGKSGHKESCLIIQIREKNGV